MTREAVGPPDRVIGQRLLDSCVANDDYEDGQPDTDEATSRLLPGPTAGTLSDPAAVHSDGISLAVADAQNNRVLVWRTFPDANGLPADVVLGHPGFDQRVSFDRDGDGEPDAPSDRVLHAPLCALLTADVLLVCDMQHHRVLVFRR